jgi:hypothetical protein
MEKTLEVHLAEQKDRIYEAVLNTAIPEPTSWVTKLLWSQARIHFARVVLEACDETSKTIIAE